MGGAAKEYVLEKLEKAIESGDTAVVKELLQKGVDVNQMLDRGAGVTPLMIAVYKGRKDIVELLIDGGAHVNAANSIGWTALCNAILQGKTEIFQLLLDRGADIDMRTAEGATAESLAKKWRMEDMLQLLHETRIRRQQALVSQQEALEAKKAQKLSEQHAVAGKNQQELKTLRRKPVIIRRPGL